jgi:RHS repeat-associated protein
MGARPVSTSGPATFGASYAYDALNRPTTITWNPAATPTTPSTTSVAFVHAYSAANQCSGQTATDNSWWFYPGTTASTVSYTANALNQYTAVGSVMPSYDGNGNLTSDGTFTYGYDAENRLTSASATGVAASYAFDGQGRRKLKTVNGTNTVFVTDADNREVLEYDGSSGTILNWYAYGLGPNDVLNQMNGAGTTRATLIPDIQGSILATLDAASGALTKTGYLPFGESGSTSGSFRYTGQRIDPETNGLHYYRARMYMPAWGRFMQVDPVGYQAGNNLYSYVNNDPLNALDSFGLDTQWGLTFGGTAALLLLGTSAGVTAGVSIPDNPMNFGGYQLFVSPQLNGMGGAGAYLGYGVCVYRGTSNGPLPIVSGGTTGYAEFDIGAGPSVGLSAQGNKNGLSGFSITPNPKIGEGLGIWVGIGGAANPTIATPSIDQTFNWLNSATGAPTSSAPAQSLNAVQPISSPSYSSAGPAESPNTAQPITPNYGGGGASEVQQPSLPNK